MHPNCRSTTTIAFDHPEIDKLFAKAQRAARDPVTGKTYYIPEDMTYRQWVDSLSEEEGKHFIAKQKMEEQYSADKDQFERYKDYIRLAKKEYGAETVSELFEGFPTRFEDFQEMKYLRPDEWEVYKENRAGLGLTVNHSDDTMGLPKKLRLPDEILNVTANVDFENLQGVIPKGTELTGVTIIAGSGTNTILRDESRLLAEHGGNAGDWKKKTGTAITDNFRYDVHWYENNGLHYEADARRYKQL